MELRQLKQFLAVAETGSFTLGAQREAVSQPAISSAIGKLETELNCRLFVRRKRIVSLTSEGEELRIAAQQIVSDCRSLKARFLRGANVEPIDVLIANTFPSDLVESLLARIVESAPSLSFNVTEVPNADVQRKMLGGKYQVALLIETSAEPMEGQSNKVTIGRERYGVAVPKKHPLAMRTGLELHDILEERFIARTNCEYRHVVLEKLKAKGLRVKAAHQTDQDDRALALVAGGLGVTITTGVPKGSDIEFVPFADPSMERRLVAHFGDQLHPKARAVIESFRY